MDLDRSFDHAASAPLLPIDVDVTADRRLARLAVTGELDGSTTTELLEAVRKVLAAPAPERVELHLAGLTFIDSAGISTLLNGLRRKLIVVCPPGPARRVFDTLGLAGTFEIVDSLGEAAV